MKWIVLAIILIVLFVVIPILVGRRLRRAREEGW